MPAQKERSGGVWQNAWFTDLRPTFGVDHEAGNFVIANHLQSAYKSVMMAAILTETGRKQLLQGTFTRFEGCGNGNTKPVEVRQVPAAEIEQVLLEEFGISKVTQPRRAAAGVEPEEPFLA